MRPKTNIRNRYVLFGDLALIVIAALGSYALRLELASNFFIYLPSMYWMIGVALVVKPIVFHFFGLYKRIWVYASVHELKVILAAVTTSSVFVSGVMIILFTTGAFYAFPRLVLVIDWLITLFAIGGLRLAPRLIAESQQSGASARSDPNVRKALVVGAGDAGALVVRELQKNTQLNLVPVGFLDDNESKQNQQIHGVPVVGALVDLEQVMNQQKIDEVIIAIPSAPGKVVRLVADVCRRKAVPFRTMPGIYELLGGKVSINRLREVDIADLLQREAVKTNDELVGVTLSSKVVMVTGAGGSIGRELCRQISRWAPAD
ncbi:MAG: polysaccharide biosynthesis protein, partial [Anaerolineaceae bacterium]|nr:polysaccharide biosynthesis protein [Anaerolineaceae bacterium]